MSRMLRIVNRVLLGLAGLLLVVFGGSVLAVGLGVRTRPRGGSTTDGTTYC